jgi:hypothetical protein
MTSLNFVESSLARIPDFIREDYPNFEAFMAAYYEWLGSETAGAGFDLKSNRDIDETIDSYVDYFKQNFIDSFPKDLAPGLDERALIKHAKEFYSTKGTPESIRLFFQIVFGESPRILYPKDSVLRGSDGKWVFSEIIKVKVGNSRIDETVGRYITGLTSGATSFVESATTFFEGGQQIVYLSLSRIRGTFAVSETINCTLKDTFIVSAQIQEQVTNHTVSNRGSGYRLGDIVTLTTGEHPAVFKVDRITRGPINQVTIETAGFDYAAGDTIVIGSVSATGSAARAIVETVNLSGGITSVRITNPGSNYENDPVYEINSDYGHDAVLRFVATASGGIKHIVPISTGLNFGGSGNFTIPASPSGGTQAVISGVMGAMASMPGEYLNTDGQLSDDKVLQDGYVYQDFSYIVQAGVELSKYKTLMKKLVHPAGFVVFGDVIIEEQVGFSLFGGIVGKIEDAAPGGGKLYRDIVAKIISLVNTSSDTPDHNERMVVYIDRYINELYFSQLNSRMFRNYDSLQPKLYGWWNFTSRTIEHNKNVPLRNFLDDINLNTNAYHRITFIQPDATVEILSGINILTTEASEPYITEDSSYSLRT